MKVVPNSYKLDIGPDSKKVLLTIYDANHIHVLEQIYHKLKSQNHEVKIISLEYDVERKLRARGIHFVPIDDYTNNETFYDLLSIAHELTMTWHQSLNNDYAVYDGILLGALPQYEMMYFFNEVLRAVRETNSLIEQEHPDIVVFLENPPKEADSILLTPSEDWHKDAAKSLLGNHIGIHSVEVQETRAFANVSGDFPSKLRGSAKNIARLSMKQVVKWLPSFLDRPLKHNILFSQIGGYIGYGILRELLKKTENKVILLSQAPNRRFIRDFFDSNFNCDLLERYNSAEIDEIVDKEREHLSKEWLIFKDDPQILERFRFNGTSIWDLVQDRLRYLFHNRFPIIVRNIELTKRCYDKMKISAIVVPYDTVEFEKMLVQVGNLKGIHSLVVLHGVITNVKILWGFQPLSATKIAVGGEALKNILIDRGCPEERIEITGFPRFDPYLSLDRESQRVKISERLELPLGAKIIFFAAQPTVRGVRFRNIHLYPRELEEMIRVVISAMCNFPDVYLIIKGRSHADEELYRRIIEETGVRNVRAVTDVDVRCLVCACSAQITGWSTVGLEAMVANKPVITVNLRGNVDFVPYVESGAAIGVYRPEDLPAAIEKALYNDKAREKMSNCQKEFVHQYAYAQDGCASSRVANLVLDFSTLTKSKVRHRT